MLRLVRPLLTLHVPSEEEEEEEELLLSSSSSSSLLLLLVLFLLVLFVRLGALEFERERGE